MKHSILLSAALALALPAQAAFENFQMGVGATYLSTVLGDPKGSGQGMIATNRTASNGSVTSIAYNRPALDVYASITLANHFKLSGEIMISDVKENTIYDGNHLTEPSQEGLSIFSTTGIVVRTDVVDLANNNATSSLDHDASFFSPIDSDAPVAVLFIPTPVSGNVLSIRGPGVARPTDISNIGITNPQYTIATNLAVNANIGKRLLKVKPLHALAAKLEYVFGDDANHGASLGVAFLRTNDEFIYTHEFNDTVGSTQATFNGGEAVSTAAFTPVTSTFNDGVNWLGVTGSTISQITDSLNLYGNASYYMRDFKKSGTDATKADIFTKDVKAKCFNGSIGLSFSPGSNE